MEGTYKNPFDDMKKISLDVNEEILGIIDDLAKLTKTSRTAVIGSLIGKGMTPFFRYLEDSWKELLKKEGLNGDKKEKVKEAIKDLKELEVNKWGQY